ncbi:putative pectinesterase inhibitor domain-containing protein [Arabidopsis thaliana]|uniref:Pectinesterase inhibitor domain-containing protein n=4 Tax=Arabidopsis TaxID=3701 RepID=A0A178UKG9_ARATH|nr:unknown [Arabidopsis thaliana]KAG7605195.1 Pectinesterase inhibitor domain [Arabidopsis thaliana x Arabidopsis arenosa]KAG7611886.1 Pectinesterase inhibitor domain [Arabidopsis suecica]OAO94516.1 hypothetical protein AXX17_AT5G45440 [Arabidopsis thaliana]CAA0408103.1 unnamed protein product [Arabidopsis thaliana]
MKFLVSLVIFSLFLNGFATAQTLIQDSCKKAFAKDPQSSYDFCVESLTQDPQSKAATTLEDLALASTKNVAAKITNLKGIVAQDLKDQRYQDIVEDLKLCLGFYKDANDSLKTALANIKSRDYDGANSNLSAALNAPGDCEDDFKEAEKKSPITNENNILYKTIVIPLAFTTML